MKKVFFLMLSLLFMGAASVLSQVTIGASEEPHPGAVLDLRSTNKGLKLPVVDILDAGNFQLSTDTANATGMIVYNSHTGMINGHGPGIYVWNGSKWMFISAYGYAVPVTQITVTSAVDEVIVGGSVQFSADVYPENATNKNYVWSVVPDSGIGTVNAFGLFTAKSQGTVKVRATSLDGSEVYDEKEVAVVTVQTGETVVDGYRVYCYPNHLGCWMTENSKLGAPTRTQYSGHADGERGYYYYSFSTDNTCPSDYRLPSDSEWTALMSYLNNSGDADERKGWFDASGFAGLFAFNQHGGGGWANWDSEGCWWTATPYKYFVASASGLQGPYTTDNSRLFSVRCVKSN